MHVTDVRGMSEISTEELTLVSLPDKGVPIQNATGQQAPRI